MRPSNGAWANGEPVPSCKEATNLMEGTNLEIEDCRYYYLDIELELFLRNVPADDELSGRRLI